MISECQYPYTLVFVNALGHLAITHDDIEDDDDFDLSLDNTILEEVIGSRLVSETQLPPRCN